MSLMHSVTRLLQRVLTLAVSLPSRHNDGFHWPEPPAQLGIVLSSAMHCASEEMLGTYCGNCCCTPMPRLASDDAPAPLWLTLAAAGCPHSITDRTIEPISTGGAPAAAAAVAAASATIAMTSCGTASELGCTSLSIPEPKGYGY